MGKYLIRRTGETVVDRNLDQIKLLLDSMSQKLQDNGDLRIAGSLGVGNSEQASTPGTVTKRLEIFDSKGKSLGFVAIYDTIT